MQVEVRALVSLFEPRGDYQLSVEAVRHAGVGNLYEAFLRLKARLEAEGLFEPAAKRALPRFPRGIAVVTSPQAAAWRDVTAALARRAPHVPVTLYPTPVQGDGAPAQIAAAIRRAGRAPPGRHRCAAAGARRRQPRRPRRLQRRSRRPRHPRLPAAGGGAASATRPTSASPTSPPTCAPPPPPPPPSWPAPATSSCATSWPCWTPACGAPWSARSRPPPSASTARRPAHPPAPAPRAAGLRLEILDAGACAPAWRASSPAARPASPAGPAPRKARRPTLGPAAAPTSMPSASACSAPPSGLLAAPPGSRLDALAAAPRPPRPARRAGPRLQHHPRRRRRASCAAPQPDPGRWHPRRASPTAAWTPR
jgi:hypothetical protein